MLVFVILPQFLQTLARPVIFLAASRDLPKPCRGYHRHRQRRLVTPAGGIESPRTEAADSSSPWLTDGPATVAIASPLDHLRPHRRVQHHHGEPAHLLSFVLHRNADRSFLASCAVSAAAAPRRRAGSGDHFLAALPPQRSQWHAEQYAPSRLSARARDRRRSPIPAGHCELVDMVSILTSPRSRGSPRGPLAHRSVPLWVGSRVGLVISFYFSNSIITATFKIL
jgi:hypothetical protein